MPLFALPIICERFAACHISVLPLFFSHADFADGRHAAFVSPIRLP